MFCHIVGKAATQRITLYLLCYPSKPLLALFEYKWMDIQNIILSINECVAKCAD